MSNEQWHADQSIGDRALREHGARAKRLRENAPKALELVRKAYAHWYGIGWPEDRAAIAQLAEAIALLDDPKP